MNKLKEETNLILGGDSDDDEKKENEDSDDDDEINLEEDDDLEDENLEDDDLEEDDLEEDDLEEDDLEEDDKPKEVKIKTKKTETQDINPNDIDDFSEKNYDSEEDSDEEEDDNILQKFNDNLDTKFLEDIHIETKSVNYDEMIALARVVRDKTGKIIDPLHTTLPFLTKYEKARIIGARSEQLDRGGEAFIPLDESIINGRTIALMEFEAKKIPFIIARPLPNGSIEYWHLSDLEIL